MTPAERVADRTWSMLGQAKELRVRFGEETLTDLLVLDMLSHTHGLAKGFQLEQTTKLQESQRGADLVVIVRHPTGRCSRLALQAKKLFLEDDRYRSFGDVGKSIAQLEKLEKYAQEISALPLYLLYNHSRTAQYPEHWHCCRGSSSFDVGQLGCTLVPSRHILRMLNRRAPPYRNFDRAHNVSRSIPWRCAFDCPTAEKTLKQMGDAGGSNQYPWFEPNEAAWPEWLFCKSGPLLESEDVDRIRHDIPEVTRSDADDAPLLPTGSDDRLSPARLLLVDRARATE